MEEFELTFPCDYGFKVIGLDEDNFKYFVMQVFSRHIPDVSSESFSTKKSRENTYLSVSVSFLAESRAQVSALYEELGADPRVKFVL